MLESMDKKIFIGLIVLVFVIIVGLTTRLKFEQKTSETKEKKPITTLVPTATSTATSLGKEEKMTELKIEDLKIGPGAEAISGKKVTVNYKGTLVDGTQFDSSYDRGAPFAFNLGADEVIQGWDLGVKGMRIGGKRKLTIPSSLGYGERGAGNVIPPNATLIFEIELLKVE